MASQSRAARDLRILELLARLVMESGGETFRAEEIVTRTASALGYPDAEVLVIPTGVFITLSALDETERTVLKRVRRRSINLSLLDEVNSVSRALISGAILPEEALARLESPKAASSNHTGLASPLALTLASAVSSGFFAMMLGGGLFDFAVAFVCGAAVQLFAMSFRGDNLYSFVVSLAGGFFIAALAGLAVRVCRIGSVESIISGAMMPLLPGLLMTNAVRDTMYGDLVSGVAKGAEAVLISVVLAAGAALGLLTANALFL